VGLPLGFLTGLRTMDDEEMGRDLIVLLLVVIWVGDTAAMYAGSLVGRHRLAPRISPKKSIEGAVAGVLGGIGGALLAHVWWFHRLPVLHAVVIGVVLGVVGIAGDLSESILKRAAGAKDSSAILPGHGGILDRIDSLLFAGPALYYYYLLFLRHP
jgi:phosphatidate cytidylyltransferase